MRNQRPSLLKQPIANTVSSQPALLVHLQRARKSNVVFSISIALLLPGDHTPTVDYATKEPMFQSFLRRLHVLSNRHKVQSVVTNDPPR